MRRGTTVLHEDYAQKSLSLLYPGLFSLLSPGYLSPALARPATAVYMLVDQVVYTGCTQGSVVERRRYPRWCIPGYPREEYRDLCA